MHLEIERKFLVKDQRWKALIQEEYAIQQGYLSTEEECAVRVRIKKNAAFITIKGPRENAVRPEFEYEIPLNDAKALIRLSKGSIIKKTRFSVNHQSQIWEIDQFEGDNQGLVIAEIELNEADEEIQLPSWIGAEVTQDERYYNHSLANNPYKNWK